MDAIRTDREGIALVIAILMMAAVAAIAAAAAMLSLNAQLISAAEERQGLLEGVADAGLEFGRARINGVDDVPTTGYATIDEGAPRDAGGSVIPGVTRSIYVGPRGVGTGQYGVFASVVSVAESPGGARVIRRADVLQESFARFAYFTDDEPSNIAFGGGDQLFGPVHSNDRIRVYASGATFHGPVTTARDVSGAGYATFKQGYKENAAVIPMPTTADLDNLRGLAAGDGMALTANPGGGSGESTLRVEFVALDVNQDGDTTDDDEGFLMAYASVDTRWVVAGVPWSGLEDSPNCGHVHQATGTFVPVTDHPETGNDSKRAALSNSGRRCYLGGAPELFGGFQANDTWGSWIAYPGDVAPVLTARFGAMADYLFPLSRAYNPDFKGVVHVTGKAAVSGVLRGRVTLAATDEIIIVDDLVYATDPSAPGRDATCEDLLGLFSGSEVLVADNAINAPIQPGPGSNYFTYDDTKDEFVHGTVLALETFTVENYASGHTRAEPCEGTLWGRGCLYLTGGIIQQQRGAVATIGYPGGTGYMKRYAYDRCAATMPPPYFPTTGYYSRDQFYHVDPVNFEVGAYFQRLAPNEP